LKLGQRVAFLSILASAVLAAGNVTVGLLAGSTSVVAAGLEFVGDVLASTFVLVGMLIASKPADSGHPYGHGRFETLAGLVVPKVPGNSGQGHTQPSIDECVENRKSAIKNLKSVNGLLRRFSWRIFD
jgi:hypothetical protein